MAALAVAGSMIGGTILYWISRRGGEAMLTKYRGRPRFVRFENWFQRYGLLTVFIPALIPIPMPLKFFVICAGVFEVPLVTFLTVMLVARVPRYIGLAYLGSQLGHNSFAWLKAHLWYMVGIAVGSVRVSVSTDSDCREAAQAYWARVKFTSIGATTSTGSPLSSVGR